MNCSFGWQIHEIQIRFHKLLVGKLGGRNEISQVQLGEPWDSTEQRGKEDIQFIFNGPSLLSYWSKKWP